MPTLPELGPTSTLSNVIDVLLGTGGRIGEVLALRWQDVDLSGEVGKVSLTGTIVDPRNGSKFRRPYTKTDSGVWVIPVLRFCTSRNITGRFTGPLMGGLNYQTEHHLFPSMARANLARAAEIRRRIAPSTASRTPRRHCWPPTPTSSTT